MLRVLLRPFDRMKLTTRVTLLSIVGIAGSVAGVGVALYLNLAAGIAEIVVEQKGNDVRAAANIVREVLKNYGTQVQWDDDGTIRAVSMWVIPEFPDTSLADTLSQVVGSRVAILRRDVETDSFTVATTNISDATGERLADWALEPGAPGFDDLVAGAAADLDVNIGGAPYAARYLPIVDAKGGVLGTLLVAQSQLKTEGLLQGTLLLIGITSALGLLIFGVLASLVSRRLLRPIPALSAVMLRVVGGELQLDVPHRAAQNEIGDIARSIEVFRDNARQITELTDSERRSSASRAEERARTMRELQESFGEVMDAATAGDFDRRVRTDFASPELCSLANSANLLLHTVQRGLSETGEVLAALAKADLTKAVTGDYQGAFLQLRDSTNGVRTTLSDILLRLRDNSGSLKVATSELAVGSEDLAERTEKQSAMVQETSSAVGRISVAVTEMIDEAKQASAKSSDATRLAASGDEAMSEANAAMTRISSASEKISKIIGMIDDIAFQTNLLALNASVEAARAGESGRGFAVVASEVRRLAQIAAAASLDVKELVESSSAEVEVGSRMVATAAERLTAMREAVDETGRVMRVITSSNERLASSFSQVSSAVQSLDESTNHNAALVEQTNAAIEQTRAQATDIDEIVSVFRLSTAG